MSTSQEKIVSRWFPRLNDPSNDVKKEAAEKLADVAKAKPELREKILPPLLKLCIEVESWPLVCNGILYPTSDIPKQDPLWLDAFLDVYICLAKKEEYVTGESAYGYIWELIEEGIVDDSHERFSEILSMAEEDEKRKQGDERKYIFSILDWYADRQ
jgi:hypothetical protein